MAKEGDRYEEEEEGDERLNGGPSKRDRKGNSKNRSPSRSSRDEHSDPESGSNQKRRERRKRTSRDEDSDSDSDSGSEPESERRKQRREKRKKSSRDYEESDSGSESETGSDYSSSEERRRRRKQRRERRKRDEKEKERERSKKRRKDKDKRKRVEEKKKKKNKDKGKTGPVTNSWGKYGILRETDMWNKRPEFTAWLLEVKKINLESLPNWEEKQMFKEFMEDHNTATFPSKKYYNLDAYYKHKMEKEMKKGLKKVPQTERTIFDDEEQRRQEQLRVRERQKEQEVEALKRSMQSGLAQAMKDQAQLREEMAYQYKIGNFEAAAAIQRRLDPDLPM